MSNIRIFDAFCGIGGFRLAFETFGCQAIKSVDIDEYCKQTYDNNFAKPKMALTDIKELNIKKLPDFDVFTAGFPCQSFSIAGKQLGLKDKRGQLIFDMLKIIKHKKPKVIFLENVKNFKTIANGEIYNLIIGKLTKYGYHIKSKIMNTCEYSKVPQNRERIYIVGFLSKKHFNKFEFPKK